MPRLRLVIDKPSPDLWSASSREVMVSATSNLSKLEWAYRVADGGCWNGKAEIVLPDGGYAWTRLVEQGATGLAWIYWDRDEGDASALDEETDLLWFGIAEDAEAARGGNTVELRLRGAGRFLKQFTYTGDHEAESIHAIADAAIQAVIDEGDSPITALDTDNAGALLRKVSISFENATLDVVLKKLADLAGGPTEVAWGVRPSADSDNFGTAYLKLWTGHLYEKDASVDRTAASVDQAQLYAYDISAKNSDIYNHITVIGDEIDGDPNDTGRTFYEAVATSPESIVQFGLRKKVVRESSLTNDGQCALLAAGIAASLGARRIMGSVKLFDAMSGYATLGGATDKANNIVTRLKNPAKILIVRDKDKPYIAWGDSQTIYSAERNASTARFSTIDTANGPTGADIVIQDPKTLAVGNKRLYELTRTQTSVAYSTTGPYIMEVEGRLSMFYYPSGGNWKLGIGYKNTGGAWVSFGLSAATRTAAQLAAEHTVALEVRYASASNMTLAAYWSNGTTTTQMLTGTLAYASLYGTGTPQKIIVNGMAWNGSAPAPAGDCSGADYSQVIIWRDWDETGANTTTTFLDAHANETAPFKHWADLVLMTNAGLTDASTPPNGWVRYAFGNATLDGEYIWAPSYSGSESVFEAGTAFSRRNYSWQLGDGDNARPLGTHIELRPLQARFKHSGDASPLQIEISAESSSRKASDTIEELIERVTEAEENARKGDK